MKIMTAMLALSFCGVIAGGIAATPEDVPNLAAVNKRVPQCAHWAVFRCCEILGAPLDLDQVISLMSSDERGHSMLSVMKALEATGFQVEAKATDFRRLCRGPFPAIAHLKPDHYVTIVAADDQYATLFDGYGRRTKRPAKEFTDEWSGKILRVLPAPDDVALPAFISAETAQSPRARFASLLIDKGEMPDAGQIVEYDYPFVNVGHSDLIVTQVKTTCACVKSERPNRPIAPSEHGVITLKYTLDRSVGAFAQEAYVQTNDPVSPVIVLTASGIVKRAVAVSPKYLNLGKVVANRPYSVVCTVEYAGEKPIEIGAVHEENDGVHVKYRMIDDRTRKQKQLEARENTYRVEFLVTYDKAILGQRDTEVRMVTNIAGYEHIVVPILADVVPPVEIYPEALVFRTDESGPQMKKQVTAVSLDAQPFRIIEVQTAHLGLVCSFPGQAVQKADITFTVGAAPEEQPLKDGVVGVLFELIASHERFTAKIPVYFL